MGRVSVLDRTGTTKVHLGAAGERLDKAEIAWLTTVSAGGQPQASPVWFHWDGMTFQVLSEPGAAKVANIAGNPAVSLHLDGAGPSEIVVTIEGVARCTPAAAPRSAYLAKYEDGFARLQSSAADYSSRFSIEVEITPTRSRVFRSG